LDSNWEIVACFTQFRVLTQYLDLQEKCPHHWHRFDGAKIGKKGMKKRKRMNKKRARMDIRAHNLFMSKNYYFLGAARAF
jgi:hypothetical protein